MYIYTHFQLDLGSLAKSKKIYHIIDKVVESEPSVTAEKVGPVSSSGVDSVKHKKKKEKKEREIVQEEEQHDDDVS